MEPDRVSTENLDKNDVLCRSGLPDWHNNACLNFSYDLEHGYCGGFRLAAELLVEHIVEKQADQDYLVYPIVFIYRHHIELALKDALRDTKFALNRPLDFAEEKALKDHKLTALWQALRPRFVECCQALGWLNPSIEELQAVDSYIKQLEDLDPNSFSFRYARSKAGKASLPYDLTHMNLRHFAEHLNKLAQFLSSVETTISHLAQTTSDMESEWRSMADSG